AGKAIVVLLFIGSIYAWTVLVTKYLELRRARRASSLFIRDYRRESHPISLYLKRQRYSASPLYEVYEKGCLVVGAELEPQGADQDELFMGGLGEANNRLSPLQFEMVRNTSERNVADLALTLESNMGVLATAVSASPFLGLLGTVWGVMDAFGSMALKSSVQLGAVAPGIAGALLTTVVGLLVAIPSAIGYNLLASQIKELQVHTDNFAQEFVTDVQRTFLLHES
ncbi:MAG: MotA/TolQ/ExbB proton channel family protein, partial [Verrucomicrobiota bacterium]